MKKFLLLSALVMSFFATQYDLAAAKFMLSNSDDVFDRPKGTATSAAKDLWHVVPKMGEQAVIITSVPASTSPSVAQNRVNTMAGLYGVSVPTDRDMNSSAWYWIPDRSKSPLGWQYFDSVRTTTHSFKGSTTTTNTQEYGHRVVVNVVGLAPANAYTITLSSSLTNVQTTTFNIATNTGNGAEIQFNPQYVGNYAGADNTNQSYYSTALSRVMAVGDDMVFDNGQYPSAVTYTTFARYGSSLEIVATTMADLESMRMQFAMTNQWLKVELRRYGTLVSSNYVESAKPMITISRVGNGKSVTLGAVGGQENNPYSIQSRSNLLDAPWVQYYPGTYINSGTMRNFTNDSPSLFFRLSSMMTP